jgi:RHS repeat-associated protein
VTDETGQKKESTTYEPFGSTRTQEGAVVSAYKFTDQELDNETGLYNYDARLYDPVLGMFVTPDSIVPNLFDPQMLNRYAYCRNNPLIYTDPTGHYTDGYGHVVDPKDGGPTSNKGSNADYNSSGHAVDPKSPKKEGVCVCTRETKKTGLIGLIASIAKQFGKQLNHAYVYDNKSKTSIGMASSFGKHPAVSEKGPGVDNCNKVPSSEDNEDEIMKEVKKAKEEAEDGTWNPGENDCYTVIETGLKNANVENPGFPDPRITDSPIDWERLLHSFDIWPGI